MSIDVRNFKASPAFLLLLLFTYFFHLPGVSLASSGWLTEKYNITRVGFDYRKWGWQGRAYVGYRAKAVFQADLCIASSPVVVDLDGDGVDDIVFAACDGFTYALHGGDFRILWQARTGIGLVSPSAADINGDGTLDIVVAGPGVLYALRGSDGKVEWRVKGLFNRAVPAISDVDCDGELEVVANTLDGKVAVISRNGTVKAWVRVSHEEVSVPAIGDIDGDGCPEIVVASGENIHVLDYNGSAWVVHTARLAGRVTGYPSLYDVDRDGIEDILVACKGCMYAIDYAKGKVIWRLRVEGLAYSSPTVADVDNDGRAEVVLATTSAMYVISLDGSAKLVFNGINAAFGSVVVADVDGDGRYEMIVARYDNELDIVELGHGSDYYDNVEFSYYSRGPFMKPASIGDVDGDGLPEIVIGCRDFNLYVVDGVVGTAKNTSARTSIPSASPTANTTHGVAKVISNISGRETGMKAIRFTRGASSSLLTPNYKLIVALTLLLIALGVSIVATIRKRSLRG